MINLLIRLKDGTELTVQEEAINYDALTTPGYYLTGWDDKKKPFLHLRSHIIPINEILYIVNRDTVQ